MHTDVLSSSLLTLILVATLLCMAGEESMTRFPIKHPCTDVLPGQHALKETLERHVR